MILRWHLGAALALALGAGSGCAPAESRGDYTDTPGQQAATGSPSANASASTGAGGGEGGAGAGGGGEGGAVPPCEDWSGPFGHDTDDIVDPTLSWEGFGPGSTDIADIGLEQLATCGGNLETRAIVVYIDALWCSVCRDVAGDLAAQYEGDWKTRGIEVVTLVVEDVDGNPATIDAAWQWRNAFGLEDMIVLSDPDYVFANGYPHTLPQALVIDPSSMRVVERTVGKVDLNPILDTLVGSAEDE